MSSPLASILEANGLVMSFQGFLALSGVDLRVQPSTVHAIIGPNGAGKTTLFNLLSGLLRPTAGHVRYDGRDITGLAPDQIAHLGVARSFQLTSIFPHLTVLDNIRLVLQAKTSVGYRFWVSESALGQFDTEAHRALTVVGLAGLSERPAHELPYGQKRALEIALALALRPALLLLDEPTSGLGLEDVSRIVALIRQVARECTVLLVEHNMGVVAALADRITVLQRGRVLAEGTYQELRTNPAVIEAYLGAGA